MLASHAASAQAKLGTQISPPKEKRSCKAPRELLRLEWPVPRLTDAFRKGEVIRIVALGSSSTEGAGASSSSASYPARLLVELQQRFPGHRFEVENLGVGGQLARDMLDRIDDSVLPRAPELVIWQTGVNDAIRGVKINDFRATVEAGLDLLKGHGIDVVLLDHQYYPGATRLPNFSLYLRTMKLIASERKVPLMRRYEIMRHMVASSEFSVEELLAPDKFHLNDVSYRCLGAAVADALSMRLVPPRNSAGAVRPN